jgi:DNA polymerase III epsilon subunit-like protein
MEFPCEDYQGAGTVDLPVLALKTLGREHSDYWVERTFTPSVEVTADADQTPEPVVHARAAAEAIRQVNHLTIASDGGLTHPADLADLLTALADLADRLPRTLGQLARIADRFGQRDELTDDRGSWHDTETTCEVVGLLLDAESVATGTRAADRRRPRTPCQHPRPACLGRHVRSLPRHRLDVGRPGQGHRSVGMGRHLRDTERRGQVGPAGDGATVSGTLAFVDLETTGLEDHHQPWEIAVVRRRPGVEERFRWFVQPDYLDLADPEALKIGRFHERTAHLNTTYGDPRLAANTDAWACAPTLAECLAELLRDAVLIGSNAQFDARMLRLLLARHGLKPTWHYRPVDVGAMAYGYLHGWWHHAVQAGDETVESCPDLTLPWNSTKLAKALGIDRVGVHEALPDAEFAMAVFDAVTGRMS